MRGERQIIKSVRQLCAAVRGKRQKKMKTVGPKMKTAVYKIDGKNGLHARPAGAMVNAAKQYSAAITVTLGEREADGKRLISLMTLGARAGDELKITAAGEDEAAALPAVISALEQAFAAERG